MADYCSFLTLRRCTAGALGGRHCWILRAGGISSEFIFRLIDEREVRSSIKDSLFVRMQ